MSLIERYVFAVTENLPEDIREDVAEELRSNIQDMLPENPTEEDIRKVLKKLGSPKKLADEYRQTRRYLIGPGLYDSYFSILKMVTGIAAAVAIGIALLDWSFERPWNDYIGLVTDLVVSAVNGVFQAAFWVTLVFAILERTGISEGQLPFSNKKWSPDDLPAEPVSGKKKISRAETAFSVFFTVLFVSIFYFDPRLIAVYIRVNGSTQVIPLFSEERLKLYIYGIILLAIVQLGIVIWKFIQGNWSVPLAVANAVQNTAASLLVIFMLNDRQLFNQEFFNVIAEKVNTPVPQFMDIWFRGMLLFTIVIFTGICLWDSISAFIKARK